MITCPFCNEKVKDPVDQRFVEDGHANDFYCPTYVKRFDDLNVSHYGRKQTKYLINGDKCFQHTAWMGPFQIVWYSTGNLWVYQYAPNSQEPNELYHKKTTMFKDFVHTCERFKVLVPFS